MYTLFPQSGLLILLFFRCRDSILPLVHAIVFFVQAYGCIFNIMYTKQKNTNYTKVYMDIEPKYIYMNTYM